MHHVGLPENVFHLYMQRCSKLATQLELCLHEDTEILANAACSVGSFLAKFLATYMFPYFLLMSLLFKFLR